MTRNGSKAAQVSHALDDEGTLLFFWDGGHRVELPPLARDRQGRRLVQVWTGETLLTTGKVDLDDLRDRHQLALHSAPEAEDDQKAWLGRFVCDTKPIGKYTPSSTSAWIRLSTSAET